ncbi:hypothetical protein F5887DRAFT_1074758 [Amanita rubescens]|nr:hypothetical protein F5887DRAFT_1074758 [Amanita rubescens]
MILVNVVNNDNATYTLLGRQCYWFADTIFGLVEKWASIHKNEIVRPEQKRKRWKGLASTGRIGVVPVYSRDTIHIGEIWDKFTKERQIKDNQREGYEESRKEEIRKASELAGQVAKLQFRASEGETGTREGKTRAGREGAADEEGTGGETTTAEKDNKRQNDS